MGVTSKNDVVTPLFYRVDMDWLQEGFEFQFSSVVKEERETVTHRLLPRLSHFFPSAKVADSFTEETFDRCKHMKWGKEIQMVVDNSVSIDTDEIDEEEDLVVFTFNTAAVDNTEHLPDEALPICPVLPGDDDSTSTIGRSIARDMLSPTGKPRISCSTSGSSVQSSASSVTLEQYNQLRELVQLVSSTSNFQFTAINEKVSLILSLMTTIATTPGSVDADSLQAGTNESESSVRSMSL